MTAGRVAGRAGGGHDRGDSAPGAGDYLAIALPGRDHHVSVALLLDERFGHINDPRETLKLLTTVFVKNLGVRRMTVWWRMRAMFGGRETRSGGDMERRGLTLLARSA